MKLRRALCPRVESRARRRCERVCARGAQVGGRGEGVGEEEDYEKRRLKGIKALSRKSCFQFFCYVFIHHSWDTLRVPR